MDGFEVRGCVACPVLHCMRQAIEAKEYWGTAGGEEFGDEEVENRVGDFGVRGAEGGKAGKGDVGGDGDGEVRGCWLTELEAFEMRVCGREIAKEVGKVGRLDVGRWG